MDKILATLVIGTFLLTGCAVSKPQVFQTYECQQLKTNTLFYWNEYGCPTEQIVGERADTDDCKVSANEQTDQVFDQCINGVPVSKELKVYRSTSDNLKSVAGTAVGMATGVYLGSQHNIYTFHLDKNPVVKESN